MKALKKLPYISSVKLARIDESYVIPTALYYEGSNARVGRDAIEKCPSPELLVEDFKIDLGRIDPDSPVRRVAETLNTPRLAPVGLAKDFLESTIKKINNWLEVQGYTLPKRILIAEPLALGGTDVASEPWLANYRKSVRKALHGRFEEIDFMPEPFAVFQYYKYGLRHPLVAESRKHVALVLDFGGGTFDVSVVETTKAGEISGGGVNSRPLGAKSVHVGGFYINRLIAEEVLFAVLAPRIEKSTVRKALNFFYENKNADEDFVSKLSEQQQSFFRNIKALLQTVELAKISVCNSIGNWSLSANLAGAASYAISVPVNPFLATSTIASVRYDASKLRKLYEERIWRDKLKSAISTTIDRAKAEIGGQDISVVLLSGGTSNIRWLQPLLERDLSDQLSEAQITNISENFQEIVAKGLATECARRYYTEGQGDFRAVTYNRLCLMLKPDDGDLERRRFRRISEVAANAEPTSELDENVLLPAASSLRGMIGKPLRWKIRLSKPPKHTLHYYFMRSSFDPEDLEARYNIVESRVSTPVGTKFQQGIEVELTVREDGTAEPKFIYGKDNVRTGTIANGKPFYIDMTFAANEISGETYLGFDFGSSTSACSFIDSRDIQVIEQRAKSAEWRDLADLVSDLPYPASAPLARYMSETDQSRRLDRGRDAVEAMLTLACYLSYVEHCTLNGGKTSLFKGFAHRSAGPLWQMLRQIHKGSQSKLLFAKPLSKLFEGDVYQQMDKWISEIANTKHGTTSSIDYVTFLGLVGNALAKAFADARFGVFEQVTPKRFGGGRFSGLFRDLTGSSPPFISVYVYEGAFAASNADVFVVNPKTGQGLCLSPLYQWNLSITQGLSQETDLYEFDSVKPNNVYSYKAVQLRDPIRTDNCDELGEIVNYLNEMKRLDQSCDLIESLSLSSYD